jgi:hypothetical protein
MLGRTSSYALHPIGEALRIDAPYGIGILVSRPYLSTSKI